MRLLRKKNEVNRVEALEALNHANRRMLVMHLQKTLQAPRAPLQVTPENLQVTPENLMVILVIHVSDRSRSMPTKCASLLFVAHFNDLWLFHISLLIDCTGCLV